MKPAFLILSLFVFISGFTQSIHVDSATHLITYSEVVQADGNQSELYSRAREWFAKTYNSSMKVIQMDSKEKIVGKALTHMRKYYGYINYTISIYLKDGKYKYEVTDLYHTGEYAGDGVTIPDFGACEEMIGSKKKKFVYYLTQSDNDIKSLIASLKESMSKQVVKKDDF